MANSISIKGTRDGLTITLANGDLSSLVDELGAHLATQGRFFRGGKVTLRIGGRAATREDLMRVSELLRTHEMMLRAVSTTDEESMAAARALGLHVVSGEADAPVAPQPSAAPSATAPRARVTDGEPAILVRRQVRSGQVLRHTGHVVVVGDVNPGAEVWATGDVVVWGRLRGAVRAGSGGDDSAIVCALELRPMQLRIGDCIARSADGPSDGRTYPEVARVREGAIVIEPWSAVRGE